MTREEAILLLHDMKDAYDEIHENTNWDIGYEQMKALDMAIEALSADAVSDAYKRGFDDCKRAYEIELARSSDAVQGEWTHDGSMWENRWVCNKCGHKIFERQTNFCPNCGARMKGGAE